MTTKDFGSTVMFFGDCIKYAELHFTGDCGRVLLVYPAAMAQRRWQGIESVKRSFQADFEKIFEKWRIDKVTLLK